MNKQFIISFDDIRESCDQWKDFEKLFQEFPEIKSYQILELIVKHSQKYENAF